jgi:uncharacterized membrane protein YpjA
VVYPSTLQMMCAVLSMIFCSSMGDWWPGSDQRWFWSNPFLIVPDAPTATIFVLTLHILLTLSPGVCTC